MGWQEDKKAADVYMPHIKAVVGSLLLTEGTLHQDACENTDLIVLAAGAKRIAVRLRSESFFARYQNEITFRSSRSSGAKTELEKMLDGWGDWFFYGFGKKDSNRLLAWVVVDLGLLRIQSLRSAWFQTDRILVTTNQNTDGSSCFSAVKLDSIKRCIIRCSENHPQYSQKEARAAG